MYEECFWCREKLGRFFATVVVGGVKKHFHASLLHDCANEYLKWKAKEDSAPFVSRLLEKGG